MKKFLITQSACWADEFDTEGFCIREANSKKEVIDSLVHPETEFPVERYFGTNESHEFQDKKEFLETLEVKEITDDEYKTLKKLFGKEFGIMITLEDY